MRSVLLLRRVQESYVSGRVLVRCALAVYIIELSVSVGVAVYVRLRSAISNHAGCRACGRRGGGAVPLS